MVATRNAEISVPRQELETIVDILFDEALRRRRAGEEVPDELLAAMRRFSAALEGVEQPSRFAKWLSLA